MITNVEIKNINSIKNININFKKSRYQFLDEMVYKNNIVNPIAFYGANGSGKSSFLSAFSLLIMLLTFEPSRLGGFTPNQILLQNEVKKLEEKSQEEYGKILKKTFSSIKICFEIDKVNYEYFIETCPFYITREYLRANDILLIKRLNLNNVRIFNKDYEDESTFFPLLRKCAKEITDENNQIYIAFNYLSNICFLDASQNSYLCNCYNSKSAYDVLVDKSKEVKELLKEYKEFPIYDITKVISPTGVPQYYFNLENNENKSSMPIDYMSTGMKNNSLLLSTILAMPDDGTLIIDEIEQALHPLTILDFFKAAKRKNIQIIFSSHNTFLLQKLRPDQIFFANWKNGASSYKKLSEIYPNIRSVNNIEKMYLSNLFEEEIKK